MKRVLKATLSTTIAAAALAFAAPAHATHPDPTVACDPALTAPDAADCAGYYDVGNMFGGDADKIEMQQHVLSTEFGFVWDGDWTGLVADGNVITTLTNGNQLDFGTVMFGETIIGAHFGNVEGDAGNVSVFWLFNFTEPTSFIALDNTMGWSNAVLYTTGGAIPEPAVWAMMLIGFGAIGSAMRRRKLKPAVHFA